MAKAKYQFNPKTLSFERVDNTIRHWANWFLSHLLTGVLTGLACFIIFALFIESPREKTLRSEREQLEAQYELLNAQLDEVQSVLTDIQQRDDNLYRLIVQADPVSKGIRMGNGDQNKYKDLRSRTNSEIAQAALRAIHFLRRGGESRPQQGGHVALHPGHPACYEQEPETYGLRLRLPYRPYL